MYSSAGEERKKDSVEKGVKVIEQKAFTKRVEN